VTVDLTGRNVRALVLDIEGTTTPVAFVSDVLFPFARRELHSYLLTNLDSDQLRQAIEQLRNENKADVAGGHGPPPFRDEGRDQLIASLTAYAEWLMDRDRKSTGLKTLQGHIWRRGYDSGQLRGAVFADVAPALARWRAAGKTIAIFSSGSILAQQLLFRTTPCGDLTRFIDAYFDTGVGAKTSPESYERMVKALHHAPSTLLFISDVAAELEAARAAGWQVLLCVRPGNKPVTDGAEWETVSDFGEIG
jgi:2,3-diketo-5-methylthio-1-phosphopentane phosphatase